MKINFVGKIDFRLIHQNKNKFVAKIRLENNCVELMKPLHINSSSCHNNHIEISQRERRSMKVIAKNIYENGFKPDVWEVEDYCQTWGLFIEDIQTDSTITDYYDFVEVNENGIVVFISKYVDEEWGRITRTYQFKH